MNTKFLDIQTDNHLNWKNHTEQIIPKLSAACYAVRSIVHVGNIALSNQFTMHTFIILQNME